MKTLHEAAKDQDMAALERLLGGRDGIETRDREDRPAPPAARPPRSTTCP